MSESKNNINLLKDILENIDHPENLNKHPWARSYMVAEASYKNPGLSALSPGRKLIQTISDLFSKMMPNMPLKRGVRLDNHWGEFGIIAAQYFAPFLFDHPYPSTLREAWQEIDQAILLFLRTHQTDINSENFNQYQLIGNEPEVAPNSTISDWHRKGIEQFADFLGRYEKNLEMKAKISTSQGKFRGLRRFINKIIPPHAARIWIGRVFLIIIIGIMAFGTWKGISFYRRAQSLRNQVSELIGISDLLEDGSIPDIDEFQHIGQNISDLRLGLESIQSDSSFLQKITPYLHWLPVYGGDLSQAPLLLEMAVQMSIAGDEIFQAISPILPTYMANDGSSNILILLSQLKDADTQLIAAQVALANIQTVRQNINTENLSPKLSSLINEIIDPIFSLIETSFPVTNVLQMAQLAPRLLGAVGNGPQTYMILIQNEDELRPTGGFLTAVGLLQMENGKIKNISFESSDLVDDLSKPYPKAPWQLDEYMMAEILLFRDSNWFTDFPTTVEWAKFLYSYTRSKTVDGVIAIDQQVVVDLLKITGPIQVEGTDDQISAENVLSYMRSAKIRPDDISKDDWHRKQFIERLAAPLIKELLSIDSKSLPLSIQLFIQLLDQKHILLQFNDPEMSVLIAQRGWDGAVQPDKNGDFLMVIDSNIGFNKTNALLQTNFNYTLDLMDPDQPLGSLTVTLTNNSQRDPLESPDCIQAGVDIRELPLAQRAYIMHDCYWSYLRVYTPANTELITSTPQEIPEKWPLREQAIPVQTDLLEENIPGIQTFGTILVVRKSESLETNFTYQLPGTIIIYDPKNKTYTYHLKVQKQPGTSAVPLSFYLTLPPNLVIKDAPNEMQFTQGKWKLDTTLKEDLVLEIVLEQKD